MPHEQQAVDVRTVTIFYKHSFQLRLSMSFFVGMSQFIVSARKYRPSSFGEVVGQEHVTRTLINEIKSNKLAQAFLFTGPRGVGKTTCARILAREINKEEGKDDQDFSFNIIELDAASNNSVDDIRSLIEQVRIPPQTGKYKVYIIDEVHMLSSSAFNAFLKTLEEPPPYAIFILATTERHKILPTILSRCQVFNFEKISLVQIVTQLEKIAETESIPTEKSALQLIAQKADGAMRDALSMFDQLVSFSDTNELRYDEVLKNLSILDYDYFLKLTDAFLREDVAPVMVLYHEIVEKGFDGLVFLTGLASHFRDLLVCRNDQSKQLLEVPEMVKDSYYKQSAAVPYAWLINALNLVHKYEMEYKASRNQRLHVELALVKLCHLKSFIPSEEALKKKS
jgi:DNA polymerase-3 subunit gamma/tau